ncbi:MAG: 1-deoxy-D-xylulose-5-phosphate reductoisomerase, partial [Solirubrobacterales bacterium]
MKRVLILGSTGSIGTQALEVIEACDDLALAGLGADRSWEKVLAQAQKHGAPAVAFSDPDAA